MTSSCVIAFISRRSALAVMERLTGFAENKGEGVCNSRFLTVMDTPLFLAGQVLQVGEIRADWREMQSLARMRGADGFQSQRGLISPSNCPVWGRGFIFYCLLWSDSSRSLLKWRWLAGGRRHAERRRSRRLDL